MKSNLKTADIHRDKMTEKYESIINNNRRKELK